MHGVGFEPTRLSPCDLKSHPLDHSGNRAKVPTQIRTGVLGFKDPRDYRYTIGTDYMY